MTDDDDAATRIKAAFALVGAAARGDWEGVDLLLAGQEDLPDLRRLCRNVSYVAAGAFGAHAQCHLDATGDQLDVDQLMVYVRAAEQASLNDQDQPNNPEG